MGARSPQHESRSRKRFGKGLCRGCRAGAISPPLTPADRRGWRGSPVRPPARRGRGSASVPRRSAGLGAPMPAGLWPGACARRGTHCPSLPAGTHRGLALEGARLRAAPLRAPAPRPALASPLRPAAAVARPGGGGVRSPAGALRSPRAGACLGSGFRCAGSGGGGGGRAVPRGARLGVQSGAQSSGALRSLQTPGRGDASAPLAACGGRRVPRAPGSGRTRVPPALLDLPKRGPGLRPERSSSSTGKAESPPMLGPSRAPVTLLPPAVAGLRVRDSQSWRTWCELKAGRGSLSRSAACTARRAVSGLGRTRMRPGAPRWTSRRRWLSCWEPLASVLLKSFPRLSWRTNVQAGRGGRGAQSDPSWGAGGQEAARGPGAQPRGYRCPGLREDSP